MVIGPYIALELAKREAFVAAFIFCMVVTALRCILAFMIRVPEGTKRTNGSTDKVKISINDLFDKKAVPYALSIFMFALVYASILGFLSLYAKELGLIETASLFFMTYALVVLIARLFTGRCADRWGVKVVVYPCMILYALGMLLLSQTHSATMLIISGAILGLGYGSVTPVFQTQTINSVGPQRVVVANSLYFNALDLGTALGLYLWGTLATFTSYQNIYLSGMFLVILAGIQYTILTQKKSQTGEVFSVKS